MSRRPTTPPLTTTDAISIRDTVVLEALALVDNQGLAAFSTRKLGARMGIQAMSLYHYFPSRETLLDATVDRMIAEIALPNVAKVGWRSGLKQLAQNYRAVGRRHLLAIPLLAQRCPSSPTMIGFLDTLLALLLKAGLSSAAAESWLLIQRDYVIGSLMADFSSHILSMETSKSDKTGATYNAVAQMPTKAREQAFLKGFNAMLDAIERECSSALHQN